MVDIQATKLQCLSLLKERFNEQEYHTWFKGLDVKQNSKSIQVIVDNRLVQDYIKNNYWSTITQILQELAPNHTIELVVEKKLETNPTTEEVSSHHHSKNKSQDKSSVVNNLQQATKLNPSYNFETLVQGNSNQLAYAIGLHITQKPGHKNHNPLFIYGGVGLGKTHLMQAIGNQIYLNNSNSKIRYLHANDYIQDVVKASMRQGFDELKRYYNNLDLLLMDDIQFIAGDKTKTQEEFFYTFNNLLERGKQIIMTCDTYHKNINNLNERLVSRFSSGLSVEIQPPELEMRVAIIKRKAEQNQINLDDEVAFFIAQNIKSNVRELEGALNKVIYQAKFSGRPINIAIAKEALHDVLALDNRAISMDDIQKVVCDFYKIKLSDLLSSKRNQEFARPRQIAMALTKELTQHSLPSIGAYFGGRNHSTVIHAQKTIDNLRKFDQELNRKYNLLIQMLNK